MHQVTAPNQILYDMDTNSSHLLSYLTVSISRVMSCYVMLCYVMLCYVAYHIYQTVMVDAPFEQSKLYRSEGSDVGTFV